VASRILVVQHGDKERTAGDPGLTDLGRTKAQATAEWLSSAEEVARVVASPMRRAVETARPIAAALGLDVTIDQRLRERMNWEGTDQTLEEFLAEWQRASEDRSFVPQSGDSSEQAADRFLAALEELAGSGDEGAIVVVAHGGITVDAIRTVLGDRPLEAQQPALIAEGVPPCAITVFRPDERRWVVELPSTEHLLD
jgi:broad specificity phosphatase PhoE